MSTINSKLKIKLWLPLVVAIIVYLLTRLINLDSLPVFVDEAIYVRWSQIIKSVETLRFIPLTDGKQPLFMWLTVPLLKFISDPLIAGRLISVFSGLGILICLFLISLYLKFNTFSRYLLLIFYIFSPFTFFFDRMALADNLLSFFGLLILYLSLLQSKYLRLDISLILGGVIGLALITKSPAIFFIVLSIATTVLLNPKIKSLLLSTLSGLIGYFFYNLLRLGPQFQMIAIRNRDYVWTVQEIIKHPLDPLKPHLIDVFNIFIPYLPGLLLTLILLVIIFYIKKQKLNTSKSIYLIIFFAWFFLPLMANAIFAKVFTARYILYTIPPLFLFVAYLGDQLKLSIKLYILLISLNIIGLVNIYKLSFSPYDYQFPPTEAGYNQDWTSGWGIKPISTYLIERSTQANVIVGTEGYFGTLPDGLQIYTNIVPNLTVFGVGVNLDEIPEKLIDARNFGDEVYLLVNNSRNFLPVNQLEKIELISEHQKPDGDSLILYKLK